jgi:peptidoglycan/LPS O-acetylase OafA/YrhL
MASSSRIQSLDGLRAISIILVLISHSFHEIRHYADLGNLGVRMFFVISSYLITGILYRDVLKSRFSISTFYFKRLMRTFPAFYFFLGILAIVLFLTNHFDWDQFWRAPFYLENYHDRALWNENQWFTGHTWSLAVEEQFYLLIALLFFYFNKESISFRKLTTILIFVAVLPAFIRILYMFAPLIPSVLSGSIHRSFETVADALAVGALIALYFEKISASKVQQIFNRSIWVIPFLLFALLFSGSSVGVSMFGYVPRVFYNLFGIFALNGLLGLLLIYGITQPAKNTFIRFLNWRPIVFIGLLSYSIYLWQQPWLFNGWEMPLALRWVGISASALISYYLIEEPFLKWRDSILLKRKTTIGMKS